MRVEQLPQTCRAALSPDEAARRTWDLLIAGAGPAGAVTAIQAARRGAAVLLVEKAPWPRWKVCGCSLNRAALETLAAVGLEDLPWRCGARRLDRMHLWVDGCAAELQLPGGAALSRAAFDAALVEEAAGSGVSFLSETEAVLLPEVGQTRRVELRGMSESRVVEARVAVAADGLAGRFLKHFPDADPIVAPGAPVGAAATVDVAQSSFAPGVIYMASSPAGYVGALRQEDGRVAVAAAVEPQRLRQARSLGRLAEEVFSACRLPHAEMLGQAQWRGTPPLTRYRRRVAADRLFVVGDAAAYLQPFTGEGMSWAMQMAVLLAPLAVESARDWKPAIGDRWQEQNRRFLAERQRVCRSIVVLLKRRMLARAAVVAVAKMPWLAKPWVQMVNTPSQRIRAPSGMNTERR